MGRLGRKRRRNRIAQSLNLRTHETAPDEPREIEIDGKHRVLLDEVKRLVQADPPPDSPEGERLALLAARACSTSGVGFPSAPQITDACGLA